MIMSVKSCAVATAVFATVALVVPVGQASAAVPEGVTLEFVSAEGDGCPEESFSILQSEFANALTVHMSGFEVAMLGEKTRSCKVRLSVVGVPEGYTYAVKQVNFAGGGYLALGESGTFQYRLSFDGTTPGEYFTESLDHARNLFVPDREDTFKEYYEWRTEGVIIPEVDLVWAPCDGASHDLLIDTTLEIAGHEENAMTLDTIDLSAYDVVETPDRGAMAGMAFKSC